MTTMADAAASFSASGIRVVAFDMDLTAVREHSRGRMQRGENLDAFLKTVSPTFVELVSELEKQGVGYAIATHSDELQFKGPIQRETHILGNELATELVTRSFPSHIAEKFTIVAYNPRVQPEGENEANKEKRFHMRALMNTYKTTPEEIVFFDDLETVVADCAKNCGVHAIRVDPKIALDTTDVWKAVDLVKSR